MSSPIEFLKDNSKKDFGILKKWTNTSAMSEVEALDNLKNLLSGKFKKLLEEDFNSLLNVLYRTDISESKVKTVFNESLGSSEIAIGLTNLYIERMVEKWETRLRYASNEVGDW